ncbi:related to RTA1 domain protein [Phialocephala subalpina]|uniref:Related to RTA1 domain protein n=1 Tax=Phialocephala subalpina TaxID=576137 RepID=A0A1L7X1K0_9HELO|nr:related to RTA1 domain protein [Phialocephala subalpina]
MAQDKHWNYNPSVPAAVVVTVIFAALTIFHVFRLFRTRTWFCLPLIIGGIFEIIGYGARVVGHYNMFSLPPYIVQALLILLAPILFAASVYMLLGRLIHATAAEAYCIIRVSWITKIFVGSDILCFLVQALGAGMLAGANSVASKNRGKDVILAGLILQIVIFWFFLLVALVFHRRLRARPTGKSLDGGFSWEHFMFMLYCASVLITVRNIFRVIEYAMGEDGYFLQKEWPIYTFDALLMANVLGISQMWYIGKMRPN